ncbi:hypothetical protein RR46_14904 [Papilio xuthus]|uniref:Uncharacterized protein n=1 Tax=Papilio xuthus TaxID=66420 RepID=A0A194PJY2_PAPXU|nr:hypothetical protein RR46_14904 [Papilio xuthus]
MTPTAPERCRAARARGSWRGAGVRHFIARAGNAARWAPRAQPLTHRRRRRLAIAIASVTFDGRPCGCSMSVTSVSALALHVYDVSVNTKSDS